MFHELVEVSKKEGSVVHDETSASAVARLYHSLQMR